MARIDRRVSPNQAALWTVYELIAIQAARVVGRPASSVGQQLNPITVGDICMPFWHFAGLVRRAARSVWAGCRAWWLVRATA